jgi:hypothetical protein
MNAAEYVIMGGLGVAGPEKADCDIGRSLVPTSNVCGDRKGTR